MKRSYLTRDSVGLLGGQINLVPNPETIATINHACNAYGFLIERGETLSCRDFAERIEKTYDCENVPQNAAVVAALKVCI